MSGPVIPEQLEVELARAFNGEPRDFINTEAAFAEVRRIVAAEWDVRSGIPVCLKVPHDPSSGIRFDKDGETWLTFSRWWAELHQRKPHLFQPPRRVVSKQDLAAVSRAHREALIMAASKEAKLREVIRDAEVAFATFRPSLAQRVEAEITATSPAERAAPMPAAAVEPPRRFTGPRVQLTAPACRHTGRWTVPWPYRLWVRHEKRHLLREAE